MREFLQGLDLEKETIDTIMAEYGKSIQSLKEDNESLKTQLTDASDKIKSFEDMDIENIKKEAEEWKAKVKEIEETQKAEKEKSIRVERTNAFFKDVKFASESAKAGVIQQFNDKDFKYDEETGKFQGASEWLEELKTKDTGAFLSDVANPKFTTSPTAPTIDGSLDDFLEVMGLSEQK